MAEEKIAKMSPKQILAAFDMFYDQDMRQRLMAATIKGLKSYKTDIRQFDIQQLAHLIELVAQYSPADLSTFYKFVEQASTTGHLN